MLLCIKCKKYQNCETYQEDVCCDKCLNPRPKKQLARLEKLKTYFGKTKHSFAEYYKFSRAFDDLKVFLSFIMI